MFQTFDVRSDPAAAPPRILRLRELMARAGVDVVLIPRSDEYLGEYVPAHNERLAFITGFTGSAGFAVIGPGFAALATDGRYLLQAAAQLDAKTFTVIDSTAIDWLEWLMPRARPACVIGYDPKLHSAQQIGMIAEKAKTLGFKLKPLSSNLVDRVWGRERPTAPDGRVVVHPVIYSGMDAADKIGKVQSVLKDDKHGALVLTMPDSIAWLLNIRGSDVPHLPVALAFAIVPQKGKVELFIDSSKLGSDARSHLGSRVRISEPAAFSSRLTEYAREKSARVRYDPATTSEWVRQKLGRAAQAGTDPTIALKACKTVVELSGARTAHERDGAAVARFLAWLDAEAPRGTVDEIGAARKLEEFRRATNVLKDISFDTISGSGPNGAIVHYRVTTATNRKLAPGELYLVDSGGQYQDGTTDITRTIAIGKPSAEMIERYTLVLKGHIALATSRFPSGTRGIQLDTLARAPLWQRGLEFDHGTGHGVGSYLSVHEGPQSISKRGMAALEPGMIVSNEPGFYKTGSYGIRIENLLVVTGPQKIAGGEREMLGFETLTLAPYDRRLIDMDLLSADERSWIDAYHKRVYKMLAPQLSGATKTWLAAATQPL